MEQEGKSQPAALCSHCPFLSFIAKPSLLPASYKIKGTKCLFLVKAQGLGLSPAMPPCPRTLFERMKSMLSVKKQSEQECHWECQSLLGFPFLLYDFLLRKKKKFINFDVYTFLEEKIVNIPGKMSLLKGW